MDRSEILNIYRKGKIATGKFIHEMCSKYQAALVTIEEQKKQIALLKKDSSTSSKPPSSDDITKNKNTIRVCFIQEPSGWEEISLKSID